MPDCAPVALFVFNRPEHTAKTLAALRENPLAGRSRLYIFQDGARNEGDAAACAKVAGICASAQGFAGVEFIRSEKNAGCAASIIAGISKVLAEHERVIVLEDDILTAPPFLDFINAGLEKYAAWPQVLAVCGYNHPPRKMPWPQGVSADAFFSLRFQGWGWGIWRDRWEGIDWTVGGYEKFMADPAAVAEFCRAGADLAPMLRMQMEGRIDAWDIRLSFSQFRRGLLCLCPAVAYTDNIGLDASGTHCGEVFDFVHNDLMQARAEFMLPDEVTLLPEIEACVYRAHSPGKLGFWARQWRSVRKRLYRWFGVK